MLKTSRVSQPLPAERFIAKIVSNLYIIYMGFNTNWFLGINRLVGKNKWLDAFGRAGAEWVIVAMIAWFAVAAAVAGYPSERAILKPIIILGSSWSLAWIINLLIGMIVKEPRPHLKHPESQLLFRPLMSWKSFPSDHSMAAFLMFFTALNYNLPLSWSLLPLALWVAWGRVYSGVHYPLDTAGGAIVAALVALLVHYLLAFL